jgi:tetratricopeptide (TPR) repeat protein
MFRWFASIAWFFAGATLFAQSTPAPGQNVGYPLPLRDASSPVAPSSNELPSLDKAFGSSGVPAEQKRLTSTERKKLGEAAYLPYLTGSVSVKISMPSSPSWVKEPVDIPMQIATFENQLRGNDADAELLLELGFLYEDKAEIKKTFELAVEFFRRRIEAEPKNGWLHAQLAEVLSELERWREAEEAAEKSVRLAPADWRCWNRCAALQCSLAFCDLYEGKVPHEWDNLIELIVGPLSERKFSDAQLERIEKRVADCRKLLDRMVEAAPNEPCVYETRCYYGMFLPIWQAAVKAARARPAPNDKAPDYFKGFRADLRTLARLAPDNPEVLMLDAMMLLLCEFNDAAPADAPQEKHDLKEDIKSWGAKWKKLSVENKQIVREDLALLEGLACENTQGKSKVAAKSAGLLHALIGNYNEAEKYAWVLLALEPKTDAAWDFLEGVLLARESDNAAKISGERVQANPTPRNHYLHAETLFTEKKFAEAEKELRAGLKQDDRHIYCRLGLAAQLLRDSARDGNLAEAETQLKAAADILRSAKEPSWELRSDLAFLRSLHLALRGDLTRSAFEFARVLEFDPDNRNARAALELLCAPTKE